MKQLRLRSNLPTVGVKRWTNERNGFRVLRIHYTADPDKRTKEWYAATRPGYSQTAWDQEFEIKFTSYAGKGIYRREFISTPASEGGHYLRGYGLAPQRPIYRVWDFGYHHPAVIFVQDAIPHHHYIFDELMGTDVYLQDFVPQVLSKTDDYTRQYNGVVRDFCDPAGRHVKSTGLSDLQILHEFNIHPVWAPFEIKDTINYVRGALTDVVQKDGMPVLLIDPDRCPIATAGFNGGYRYPDARPNKQESEKPLEDGYYEHLADDIRYYAGHKLQYYARRRPNVTSKKPKDLDARFIEASHLTTESVGPGIASPRAHRAASSTSDFNRRYPGAQRIVHKPGDQDGADQAEVAGGVARRQVVVRRDYNGPVYTPRA